MSMDDTRVRVLKTDPISPLSLDKPAVPVAETPSALGKRALIPVAGPAYGGDTASSRTSSPGSTRPGDGASAFSVL